MVKTSIRVSKNPNTGENRTMPTANVIQQSGKRCNLRSKRAGLFAVCAAFARAEGLLAMRMRMHAKQADAAAAAL